MTLGELGDDDENDEVLQQAPSEREFSDDDNALVESDISSECELRDVPREQKQASRKLVK